MTQTDTGKPRGTRANPPIKGHELRDSRLDLCLTLLEVCMACTELDPMVRISTSNLSQYERGLHSPGPKRLRALAQVLGKTPDDFLVQPRNRGDASARAA
jgi:transcriptional regulator with XRE-family HTH domain